MALLALDAPSRFYGQLAASLGRSGSPPDASGSASAPGAGGHVLVLGAGDGVIAAALASRGHDVLAVEPSPSLRALVTERRASLSHPERLSVIPDDPRTLELRRKFALVLAPHQALGLARSPDELHAFLTVIARHLEPEGTFAFDALNESTEVGAHRSVPHLRERTDALHPLSPLRLSATTLDEALDSVGLVARERFSDFNETPFTSTAGLQVVVGGLQTDV